MYRILRSILFLFSPEWVHYFSMNCLKLLCSARFIRKIIAARFVPKGADIPQPEICNLKFKNPVGLGAGFDKNARYLRELEALGFGFIEIGTVTPVPQAGNEKPRLFRLPKDNALLNRMGFNNDGVKVVAERLKKWKKSRQSPVSSRLPTVASQQSESIRLLTEYCRLIIGGNIGKNKKTPNEDAWKDYEICFKELHPYVDYFVVNVSSPNTPGLRELQEKESLRKILTNLQKTNAQQTSTKPILLKISPDLTRGQIDDVVALALEIKLDGIVATNTTINRLNLSHQSALLSEHIGTGGLSGAPLKETSTEIVKYIHQKTKGQIPVIASGGIITADDAMEKFESGASLVQVWTGFIYEGPGIIKQICEKLKKFTPVTTASK
ncbi:MAG: quinone-dependent dihydroorotate dehydrogenase [Chitinophagaceae bacterium]|nr:quinone-dependent dihydroorotate dehydrogenase [Chitinophagaceae bacterium]